VPPCSARLLVFFNVFLRTLIRALMRNPLSYTCICNVCINRCMAVGPPNLWTLHPLIQPTWYWKYLEKLCPAKHV
jgi:hypothetical protein